MTHSPRSLTRLRLLLTITLSAIALALAGCSEAEGERVAAPAPEHSPSAKATIATLSGSAPYQTICTVGMLGDIVAMVGGDRLRVDCLMGPGTDPHLYTATPGDRNKLLDAKIILYVGHHLEGKMVEILEGMGRRVPTLAVCEQVDPARLRHPPEFEGAVDPHLWFDVSLWAECAENVCNFLVHIDPAGADGYRARMLECRRQFDELDAYARRRFSEIPAERRVIVTAHDAFGYLGAAYGVEVIGIQGISTESEAAVSRINDLVAMIVKRRVPAVFVESTISEKNVRSLIEGCAASGHALKVGGSLYSDAMGAAGTPAGTYVGMVRHNVDTIVEALK